MDHLSKRVVLEVRLNLEGHFDKGGHDDSSCSKLSSQGVERVVEPYHRVMAAHDTCRTESAFVP